MAKAAKAIVARDVRPQAKQPDTVRIVGGANPAPAANPREVIGNNMPPADLVIEVQERLPVAFADLENSAAATLREAHDLPKEIESPAIKAIAGDLMRKLRDIGKTSKSHREAEKNPFLRAGQAVDGFFNAITLRVDTAFEILQKRVKRYDDRIEEEERLRREAAAAEARRIAQAARDAAEAEARRLAELQRQNELAEQRAAESNRPKVQQKAEVTARDVRGQEGRTDALLQEAQQLERAADLAEDHANVPARDLVKQRTAGGTLMTTRTFTVVKVENYDLLPLERLRPHMKREELDRAVKQLVKIEGNSTSIPGVRIYEDSNPDVR